MSAQKGKKIVSKREELILEYAGLAVEKLRIGTNPENSEPAQGSLSEIDRRMSEIRSELGIGHAEIISASIEYIN